MPSQRATTNLALALALLAAAPAAGAERFIRGDSNADVAYDIADPMNTLNVLFRGVGAIPCGDAADANDDGKLNLSDAAYSLAFLFRGGRPPAAPFPSCGVDPTADSLGCRDYPETSCPGIESIARVAGHCGGVPESPYPNSLKPGDELHKVTVDAPQALCNDGTPAIYYVRAAPVDGAHADDWVIYLQGGGGCSDWQSCLERWCGRQSRQYDESKMSSRYTPETVGGEGIFAADAANGFADWNHVYVYYCSSDSWSGQREAVLSSPENPSMDYTIQFRGRDIVAAVTRELFDGVRSDDGEVELPPLGEGRFILFTGSSAGASGVAHNGDWFASLFDEERTQVRLVRDAGFQADYSLHPDAATGAALAEAQELLSMERWETSMSEDVQDAFLDESCRAYADANGEPWRCGESTYVVQNHITTPVFQRGDLFNPTSMDQFIAIGGAPEDYALLNSLTLASLAHVPGTAVESSDISRQPGAFGPSCSQHISLTNVSFLRDTVEDASGTPRSFHDALVAWLRGADVAIIDDPDTSVSSCGPHVSNAGE